MDLEKPAPESGELIEHQLLAHELEIARRIQQSLLPRTFPGLPGFDMSGFCLSARQVGGDFYDVITLAHGKALLVVADVMGKGIPAALFGATLHTLVRTVAEWTSQPALLLKRVNRLIFDDLSRVDMFITVSVALIDTTQDKLSLANAGHCPLLLKTLTGRIEPVSAEGVPLGIMPDAIFEQQDFPLCPCQCVLLYTDGVTEASNAKGEFFGQKRLMGWLSEVDGEQCSATGLRDHFELQLRSFQAQTPLRDDQTFLILARQSREESSTSNVQAPEKLQISTLAE
jgi:serine phosphatase RsbU (regulator of sigma subunit)